MDTQPVRDLTAARGRALAYRGPVVEPSALADLVASAIEERASHIRLDLPWSLVQPTARRIDGDIVEAVATAATMAHGAGLAVWCRLLQPELPRWFDDEGGFADDRATRTWWPRWVDLAAEQVGAHVDGWVPFEAPFGIVSRHAPEDHRRQGEIAERLVVAWRDAWRLLRGQQPVATSLDLAIERGTGDEARRRDLLRWDTWFGALREGAVRVPGRIERRIDDLVGSCDQLGVALAADDTTDRDLEDLLTRIGEQRLSIPLAVTVRAVGTSDAQRRESLERFEQRLATVAGEAGVTRLTLIA